MKISTKGRYALRLMLDLAMNNTGENISLKAIAERQDVSVKYLEQIIAMLNRAGYVRSERGAGGGYRLTMKPEQYTVGMILRLTEGDLCVTSCTAEEQNHCERYGECVTVKVWDKINKAISDVVDNITLADLLEEEKEMINDFVI